MDDMEDKMNKEIALKLSAKAREIAENFSKPDREFNLNKETFQVEKIIPLSEKTAVVKFFKSSGKKAIAFLYYINMKDGSWQYVFPTWDMIAGMDNLSKYLLEIEQENYPLNFQTTLKR